jgi:assimilatory nitrate reductase catalytic subunit
MIMSSVQTTCPYCGVGCGVLATVDAETIQVQGDKTHPANFGRLCSKGSALAETLSLDDRLLQPEVYGEPSTWDKALSTVASELQRIIEQHGKQAVAIYASGQLLTEDYYVANKFMKGFIGTANIDTNSRLCMSSSVAGQQRAFGSDSVPCSYEDLEKAELIVLVGSNLAWCHPVLYQRINARKQAGEKLKIVVIDPRRTNTCDIADLHLPIKSGSDVWLFNGLLNSLRVNDCLDFEFIEQATQGIAKTLEMARISSSSIPLVAQQCGLSEADLAEFFRLFARTEKVVTLYSQGVNQSSAGTDKVNSIINCHLASGRIGKVGMGAFSITGQPNAMGGREVGGLANQLAAHMRLEPEHCQLVQEFWRSPNIANSPGLKAVELFNAIERGEVKAVWIMATNPVVSLPNADQVKRALSQCELVIVSDCVRNTDTTQFAHVLFPALGWGEKDGTVTNSERRISRQRAFLDAPELAKADWWIISEVATRMGFASAFNYQTSADIFREHAALSAYRNHEQSDGILRDFNLRGLSQLNDAEYNALQPIQWPVLNAGQGTTRLFSDWQFFTPNKKANFIPITPRGAVAMPTPEYPFILNTGRIRDQWHTMTRTGKTPRLLNHLNEPFVELHPQDARRLKIQEHALVMVKSRLGKLVVRARFNEAQQRGTVFVPIHWQGQLASLARVGSLIAPEFDPISGQPEFKHTPVQLAPYPAVWQAFMLSRDELPNLPETHVDYWAKIRGDECWRYEFAGDSVPEKWSTWVGENFGENREWLEFQDKATGRYRCASIAQGRLSCCLFIGSDNESLPAREGLTGLFAKESLEMSERLSLLTGKTQQNKVERGAVVCACFNVGKNTIIQAIKEQGLQTPAQITQKLKAGGNCGSCVPELKALLAQHRDS